MLTTRSLRAAALLLGSALAVPAMGGEAGEDLSSGPPCCQIYQICQI